MTVQRYHIDGPLYVDEHLLFADKTGPADRAFYYLLRDLYTVAGLADEDGNVVEAYDYDAYGRLSAFAPQGDVADADRDGDVDVSDFECLQRCFSGAGQPIDPACTAAEVAQLDIDADADIDADDMAVFLDCWQGPDWAIHTTGDYDADGWITSADVGEYLNCLEKDLVQDPQCAVFDFDASGALDPGDYGTLLGLVGQPAGTLWGGCVIQLAGSAVGNPYFFTGRRLDAFPLSTAAEPVQLYHYRARTYDPVHGRFLQRDPAGYVDGGNLFEYVASRPLGLVDPSGEITVDTLLDFGFLVLSQA